LFLASQIKNTPEGVRIHAAGRREEFLKI